VRVGILGCAGRMGRQLVRAVADADGLTPAAGTVRPGSPDAGRDLGGIAGVGTIGVAAGEDPAALFAAVDVAIDFTLPDAAVRHAALAAQAQVPMVIGTTGLSAAERDAVARAAHYVPVVLAPNTSLGVALAQVLVEQAARVLGPDEFDVEILEMHHRRKADAPSGTALALGEAAAAGRGIDLAAYSARVRDGHTGPRRTGDIGFAVMRGGGVVGEHAVVFAGEAERIEVHHKAADRMIFARGAVRAARWVRGQAPGLYGMRDVLGLGASAG